jgi:DNA-binding NarL/FixJ family response regulator
MSSLFKKRVAIVEDDKILRESFAYIVNSTEKFVVVGNYGSAEEALPEILRRKPEIILMDIQLPGKSGIEATEYIKDKFPHIEVVIVTVIEDYELVFNALKAGASGYITKSANYLELLSAIDEIVKGGAPMSTKIARMVIDNFHVNPHSPLTSREKEVLHLIAEGKTYTQISEDLFISRETSKTHIRNIYSKLHVNKKSKALEIASQKKYI